MGDKIIFTIGRQFGSGGRMVGKKLAEKLGIPYYDKELLAMAAKDSGYSEELSAMQTRSLHPLFFIHW